MHGYLYAGHQQRRLHALMQLHLPGTGKSTR
jgi:hypothetical protein